MASAEVGSPMWSCHFATGQLTRHDRRAEAVAVIKHFDEVAAIGVLEWRVTPVVDHQYLGAGQAGEQAHVGTVGAGQSELVGEARGPPIERAVALAARLLGLGASDVRLAGAGQDHDIVRRFLQTR